ncbi:MAG TPA: class I SAM-dependent methyltransferase [Cyclobacteriaceae bacterium]|nr:class I SAM-dependent methyltransferase [Cyclobacteriaceae bacterium]
MKVYSTEITSDKIRSDNPIHQRLLMPYYLCREYIQGDLLELGCGEGRGIGVIREYVKSYLGIDKIETVIRQLTSRFQNCGFKQMTFPPLTGIENNTFDSIISFQVIEHIKKDEDFLREIFRVLKPGGTAMLTTPNRKMSLTRNPWHIREYSPDELAVLCRKITPNFSVKGIAGNEKVMEYYTANKNSVKKLTRFDFLNLQYRLPAFMLRLPYEILNRVNRNHLSSRSYGLADDIRHTDYRVSGDPEISLDLLCIIKK